VAAFVPTTEQAAILGHDPHCHARVLAGPGTGKSATLVALIEDLLGQDDPPRIKLLTFTRTATTELAGKVAAHPHAAAERPSTVHSFALSVLVRNPGAGGLPQPLRIADTWEQKNVVNRTLSRRLGIRLDRIDNLFREMAANWERLEKRENAKVKAADREKFLGGWDEHRRTFGHTHRSELPYALRQALKDHDDLDGVDYDLLVVDEYQDLNACDLEVLRLLTERGCRVIGAGDDDQSIYGFRWAAPEGIRRFPEDYPGSGDYHLSVTQRCGTTIIEWATHVINGDPDRPAKPPLDPKPGSPPKEVALLGFKNQDYEAKGIAILAERLIKSERLSPSDVLILLRTDHNGVFSKPIKEHLEDRGVEVADPDRVARVLEQPDNRKLLEMLRLLVNQEDSIAWAALLSLTDGIGDKLLEHLYEVARSARITFGAAVLRHQEKEFEGGPKVSSRKAAALVRSVRGWLDGLDVPEDAPADGWGSWILAQAGGVAPAPDPEFRELLEAIDDVVEQEQDLLRYLAQIEPVARDLAAAKSDGVRIMSMASSKGLTVEAAILGALEDGLMPRPEADLAEERRLLYVGMTRAKRFLYGTWARRRTGPTARAGLPGTDRRQFSNFLRGGPVDSEDGPTYLKSRFP